MAISTRQNNLYAGEDWTQVYESFRKINLQSYDFDTIRSSMVNYIQTTYPDSFNDWIENDEFIFILDTISLVGQNLAFRMDLNSRENFLDTAERRSSVLKLAKMISYSPRRCYPARGLAKLTEISTNQDIRNSNGDSLKGLPIRWNDPIDNFWYENFILVLNSCFISSNQFGDPIKKVVSNSITNYIYRMNTLPFSSPAMKFTANVNGESMNMEVINPDVTSDGTFEERHPEPQAQHNIIYRNDGNGFSSPATGFFVSFKQGTLSFEDYQFDQALENRTINVDSTDINELDVWVQEITDDAVIRNKWTKVPAIESVAYTSVNRELKNIYSVTTRDNDAITIKFPDSRSGNVPRGLYRIWFRKSNGKTYTIKTYDVQDKSIQYTYRTNGQSSDESSTLTVKFSLQTTVDNALAKETLAQIKERAPQNYYLQNRVVTGEDYNIAPQMLGNAVLKSKAINRLYSGQSRFIDINDSTGKYQNTDVFADDGAIYRDEEGAIVKNSVLLPTSKSNSSIVIDSIQPLVASNSVIQRYQEYVGNTVTNETIYYWNPESNSSYTYGTYGKLSTGFQDVTYDAGTLILFSNSGNTSTIWSSVVSLLDTGYVVLSEPVTTSWIASKYIKLFRTKFNTSEVQLIGTQLAKQTDFILYYNSDVSTWNILEGTYVDNTVEVDSVEYPIFVKATYNASSWDFISYGVNYVFIGGDKVKFYFVSTSKISDISTGTVQNDKINLLSVNNAPANNNGYSEPVNYQIIDTVNQENGYMDGSRVLVTSAKLDSSGIPLNPNIYRTLVPEYTGTDKIKYQSSILLQLNEDFSVDYYPLPADDLTIFDSTWTYTEQNAQSETVAYKKAAFLRNIQMRSSSMGDLYNKASGFIIGFRYNDDYYFVEQTVSNNNDRLGNFISNMSLSTDTTSITPETAFYRAIQNMADSSLDESKQLSYYGYSNVSNQYIFKDDARVDIAFQWKHYAPDDNRIDPSKTNIIDMYVLTTNYRDEVDLWVSTNDGSDFPKPPTSSDLKEIFTEVETKIVVSDSTIWHSARYLPLFGSVADNNYKATFKVVRAPNSKYSDDEIRQKVIELTNNFFNVDNWDFGESFYFTELSFYIHQQLGTDISTIVIVPQNPNSKFGTLFEIPSDSDQLFVNTATVDDVVIVNSLSQTNINIGN